MKLFIGTSTDSDSLKGIDECLSNNTISNPDLIMVYCTESYESEELVKILKNKFVNSKIVGTTSCFGVMTNAGLISNEGQALSLALFKTTDPSEFICAEIKEYVQDTDETYLALNNCLEKASNFGPRPSLIWLVSSPGNEESSIQSIEKTLGHHVPIYGGTAADNTIAGNWKIFDEENCFSNGSMIITFYSNDLLAPKSVFNSAYFPTGESGVVTKAKGRSVIEIDNRPAIDVYNEWSGSSLDHNEGERILTETSLAPIGRPLVNNGSNPFFLLSHPDSIEENGAINLFTDIKVGDEVHLMSGSAKTLKSCAKQALETFIMENGINKNKISGAMIVYCAGCMLSIKDEDGISEVVRGLNEVLGDIPYLGSFSFGEQGSFLDNLNLHGNLMLSVTLFFD